MQTLEKSEVSIAAGWKTERRSSTAYFAWFLLAASATDPMASAASISFVGARCVQDGTGAA